MNVKNKLKTTGFQIKEIANSISDISQGAQIAPTGIRYLLQPLDEIDIKEIKEEFGINAKYNWQCFYTASGALVTYAAKNEKGLRDQFMKFVRTTPPEGLGATPTRLLTSVNWDESLTKTVKSLLPALAAHGRPTKEEQGKPVNNRFYSTSDPAYILARLKRDRADIAQKVVDGELTANEAAIKAGIRKKYVSVRCDPEGFAKKIKQVFSDEEINEIISLL